LNLFGFFIAFSGAGLECSQALLELEDLIEGNLPIGALGIHDAPSALMIFDRHAKT